MTSGTQCLDASPCSMNESKATRYQRSQRRARAAGLVSGGVMLALVALTPLSRWLARWRRRRSGAGCRRWPHAAAVAARCSSIVLVVAVGAGGAAGRCCTSGWRVDSRYGPGDVRRSTTCSRAGAGDAGRAARGDRRGRVDSARRLAAAGSWWWLMAGLLLAGCSSPRCTARRRSLARLAGARPLARRRLAARLGALARQRARADRRHRRAARAATTVARPRSSPAPADRAASFIAAELVRDWSDDEIAVVVAHELGASRASRSVADARARRVGAVASRSGRRIAWRGSRGDAARRCGRARAISRALPLVALVAGAVWLAATPLRHALSRRQERRADEFALALTGGADAFSAAIRRLGARHLAEERPSALTRWLYHRHPSVAERLALRRCARARFVGRRDSRSARPVVLGCFDDELARCISRWQRSSIVRLQPISNVAGACRRGTRTIAGLPGSARRSMR